MKSPNQINHIKHRDAYLLYKNMDRNTAVPYSINKTVESFYFVFGGLFSIIDLAADMIEPKTKHR